MAQPKVKIAGDPDCPACQSATRYFDQKNVAYDFRDINTPAGMRMANRAKAEEIPVIQVCAATKKKGKGKKKKASRCTTMIGFDPGKLKRFGF